MPRYPRQIKENWVYHVLQRGNNRQAIFFSDKDFLVFKEYMLMAKTKYPCRIFAYALMSNHFHLLLQPLEKKNLSYFMKMLSQKYTQYINKSYSRTGGLWQGKYKFCPVAKDEHLLKCSVYIEGNPIRAGIVIDPTIYPYSSLRGKIGLCADSLIDFDPIYMSSGNSDKDRQDAYKKLFYLPLDNDEIVIIRNSINKEMIYSGSDFKETVEKFLGRKLIYRPRGRPKKEKIKPS